MGPSFLVYAGFVIALGGLLLVAKPIRTVRIDTRARALLVVLAGLALSIIGFALPADTKRIDGAQSRLDEFVPEWQFSEHHAIHVDAPPARVFDAIQKVRASEITFFQTLTWIRRGGRDAPESILNAGSRESLIDVATRNGFVSLAVEVPKELVIGTVVVRPRGWRERVTPEVFRTGLPPGGAIAGMNFTVRPDASGGSLVSTETRVFANDAAARRRFKRYWRLIYPGSAIIRRMWLRAIRERAEASA